jgi:LSU ribosomal protein L5P
MPSWKDLVLVKDHPMRRIFIEKVVVNIGVGASGEKLERAAALLKELTGAEPSRRRAKRSIKDFGIRKGEPIGVASRLGGIRLWSF